MLRRAADVGQDRLASICVRADVQLGPEMHVNGYVGAARGATALLHLFDDKGNLHLPSGIVGTERRRLRGCLSQATGPDR
jgi:hypothetical protein